MSDQEIRFRRTGDPEIDALRLITEAFAPLDEATCDRILTWARERFVTSPTNQLMGIDVKRFNAEIKRIREYGARLGTDEQGVVHAIKHIRAVKRLAPVADDPDAVDTECQVRERLENG